MIKIGFTGTRHGLSEEQKNQIKLILDKYDNIVVLHGDCIGSDTDFHNLCRNENKNIKICILPPNNPTLRAFNSGDLILPEKPYLERNSDIVENSDILIACPLDKNKEELRSGTWSTIRKAKKRGMMLYIL